MNVMNIKLICQNIGGTKLGNARQGGGIISTRLWVNNNKPHLIILSETRIGDRDFDGKGIFRGYYLAQHSSSGQNNRGILVFARAQVEKETGYEVESERGYYTVGVYNIEGSRIIVAGVYGPSENSDRTAYEIYEQMIEKIEEIKDRSGIEEIIIAGDFNLHLDAEGLNPKGRTCRLIRDYIEERQLKDQGKNNKCKTWRRPGRKSKKSRIDYVLTSERLSYGQLRLMWSKYDHAMLVYEIASAQKTRFKGKDWVLTSKEFIEKGRKLIEETILDHSIEFRQGNREGREKFVDNRAPKEYESEIKLIEIKEGIFYSHILMVIISKLEHLQRNIQVRKGKEKKQMLDEFNSRISRKYKELDEKEKENIDTAELQEEIRDIQTELRDHVEGIENAKRIRVENYEIDKKGKNNAYSFLGIKEPKNKKEFSKIKIENEEITDRKRILTELQRKYEDIVSKEYKPDMKLVEFLTKYEIDLPKIDEATAQELEREFTIDEIRSALKEASSKSAPGPSGQTIGFYKFIFTEIPNIVTNALNEITFVPEISNSCVCRWIKDRKIVYIPKPGKDSEDINNLRPLSMLETLYKIQTRMLAKRLGHALEEILSKHQHGFRPKRSIQTASIPILHAINEANIHAKPMQLLAVDLKSAFDTISSELIYEIMLQSGFPSIYSEALHGLVTKGTASVQLGNEISNSFEVKNGVGQGDPPSAQRFSIGTDPLVRALQKRIRNIAYKFQNGMTLPGTTYADDNMLGLNIRDIGDVDYVLEVFRDYEKVSGLKMNLKKTEILCINTSEEMKHQIVESIGIRMVTEMTYLGLELKEEYEMSKKASYEKCRIRVMKKAEKIQSRYYDIFHRRMLINQGINPIANHVCMVFGPSKEYSEFLDSVRAKILWDRKIEGEIKKGRRLIARGRIEASQDRGGLEMASANAMYTGLGCNLVSRMAAGEDKNEIFYVEMIEKILESMAIPKISELKKFAGSLIWEEIGMRMRNMYPAYSWGFESIAKMLQASEKTKQGWKTACIAGHSLGKGLYRINRNEGYTLMHYGITHVSQLFKEQEHTGKIDIDSDIEYPMDLTQRHAFLVVKCKYLRQAVSKIDYRNDYGSAQNIFQVLEQKKLSTFYRKLILDEISGNIPGPPSYYTRQRDGIMVPDIQTYMQGYRNINNACISSKTKEIAFLIMNRQIWTNEKQEKTSINRGEIDAEIRCGLCNNTESTQHILFSCTRYSVEYWEIFSEIVSKWIKKEKAEHPTFYIHLYNIMYNTEIKSIPDKYRKITAQIIQESKRDMLYRRYKRCENPKLNNIRYNRVKTLAHIMLTVKKIFHFYEYTNKNTELIDNLLETLKDEV